ncbi:hypothetical protein T484DRAFT_1825603, partial [Baffinella frigidus]
SDITGLGAAVLDTTLGLARSRAASKSPTFSSGIPDKEAGPATSADDFAEEQMVTLPWPSADESGPSASGEEASSAAETETLKPHLMAKSEVAFSEGPDGEWTVGLRVKINLLQEHLHISYRRCDWDLLFSSKLHGFSLSTLFRYTPVAIQNRDKPYGNSQCFVFSLHPSFRIFQEDVYARERPEAGEDVPSLPPDTGAVREGKSEQSVLVRTSEQEGFAFGGTGAEHNLGAEGFAFGTPPPNTISAALSLDTDLREGSSVKCGAYGNPSTIAGAERFSIRT